MSSTITYGKVYESKTYYQPFVFRGNIEAKVKKLKEHLGDGDIGSKDKTYTMTALTANLSFNATTNIVRLTVRYAVWEPNYNINAKKSNQDYLYFDAYQNYDVSEFVRAGKRTWTENRGSVKKESTPTAELASSHNEFYITDFFNNKRHDWVKPSEKYGNEKGRNRIQSWVDVGNLRMKIDDSGNELTKEGNIGVSGYIRFTIKRTDSIKITTTIDEVASNSVYPLTKGNETKVEEKDLSPILDSVLCRGYDICGRYADSDYCKDRVLDYRQLNEYQRLNRAIVNSDDSETFSGEGIEEYTSSIEKSLNVKVSASAFGASFSNETSMAFKEEKASKAGYKFLTQKDVIIKEKYTVQGATTPKRLTGFLTPHFLEDLNSLTADQMIKQYGTHVVLGMKTGARFFYNMSYQESSCKQSTSSSFKNSTSISYNSDGSVQKDKNNNNEQKSKAEQIYEEFLKGGLTPEELNAYTKYLEAAKNATPASATGNGQGSKGGLSGGIDITYSETNVNTLLREDKSTNVNCYGKGGKASLISVISRNNDLTQYSKWIDTVDDNPVFADFVPEHLIPIYELVPAGYRISAQALKEASERYQISKGYRYDNAIKGTTRVDFNTLGNESNTHKIQGDWEISSQSGKKIYWKVKVELVNYDDGHCGYAVSFTVKEGGKTGTKSILMSHAEGAVISDPRCTTMAIDTSRLNNKCMFEADSEWTGKYHGWQDATKYVKNSGDAKMVIDCDGALVSVYLDGNGDDWDHIGIKGTLIIPWLGY